MHTAHEAHLPSQVLVLLQAGVAVGREHLAMGVHVNPSSLSLLEQLVQVMHVVPLQRNSQEMGGCGGPRVTTGEKRAFSNDAGDTGLIDCNVPC